MNAVKTPSTTAIRQIASALKRAGAQARKRAKAYGTEALIEPLPSKRPKRVAAV